MDSCNRSNIYGLKDSFIENKSGLSFELNNAKDLASKIKILLYDEEKYNDFKILVSKELKMILINIKLNKN